MTSFNRGRFQFTGGSRYQQKRRLIAQQAFTKKAFRKLNFLWHQFFNIRFG